MKKSFVILFSVFSLFASAQTFTVNNLQVNGATNLTGTVSGTGILNYIKNSAIVQTVTNVAALRALSSCVPGLLYADQGYYVNSDGGSMLYVCNGSDTTTPDNGGSILATSGTGYRLYAVYQAPMSIRAWGAKCDSVTDDSSAFSAALNWANLRGASIYVPASSTNCVWANPISIAYTSSRLGFRLIGDAANNYTGVAGSSSIKYTNSAGYALTINGDSAGAGAPTFVDIQGVTFIGNSTASGAINFVRSWSNSITQANFQGFNNALNSVGVVTVTANGAGSPFAGDLIVRSSNFENSGVAILLTGVTGGQVNIIDIEDSQFLDSRYGVVSNWPSATPFTKTIIIKNNHFEGTSVNDIYSQNVANNWTIEDNYIERNTSIDRQIYITGSNNLGISITRNALLETLTGSQVLVQVDNANGLQFIGNTSSSGGVNTASSGYFTSASNAYVEPAKVTGTTPYPVVLNNLQIFASRLTEQWNTTLTGGTNGFDGISAGDGWPGGTVQTVVNEANRTNGLVRINFKTTITTKSGSGTNFQIGLLPWANTGVDTYFPVFCTSVTGTRPFYGVLLNGGTFATVYDATGTALNYQTAVSVGTFCSANFTYLSAN